MPGKSLAGVKGRRRSTLLALAVLLSFLPTLVGGSAAQAAAKADMASSYTVQGSVTAESWPANAAGVIIVAVTTPSTRRGRRARRRSRALPAWEAPPSPGSPGEHRRVVGEVHHQPAADLLRRPAQLQLVFDVAAQPRMVGELAGPRPGPSGPSPAGPPAPRGIRSARCCGAPSARWSTPTGPARRRSRSASSSAPAA